MLDVCLVKGILRARPIDSMRPPRADKTGKRAYSAKFRVLAYMSHSRLPKVCRGQLSIMTRDVPCRLVVGFLRQGCSARV